MFLTVLAPLALILSGLVHLLIISEHLQHTPIHAVFFGLIGVLQIVWAIWVLWRKPVRDLRYVLSGASLSGGVIVLWLITFQFGIPFSTDYHPIDANLVITKVCEFIALASILFSRSAYKPRNPLLTAQNVSLMTSVLVAGIVWGGGMLAMPLFPQWVNTHAHYAIESGANIRLTSAYFSIVSGINDTLVSMTAPNILSVSLHNTTITNEVASMTMLDSVPMRPHSRVDFSQGGQHLMLNGLQEDLMDGDTVTLTLHFESGATLDVPFAVRSEAPIDQINFIADGEYQVRNAWVFATASYPTVAQNTYDWNLPEGIPLPAVPANNPMTDEKVELGRFLFYDVRLSGNGGQSCASCHLQRFAFTDRNVNAIGSTGEFHPRNAMTLTNAAYNATYTWANPNLLVLERQIPIPMFGEFPVELGITGNEEIVLERFRTDENYQRMFAAAFPDANTPITYENITKALSSFVRTLISVDSPYDRYLRGDENAISPSAQRGAELFFSEQLECHHCHTGFNFSLSTMTVNSTFPERPFFNTGLYNIDGQGAYPHPNTGVYEITANNQDIGRFRPVTLRNIALTAPYMHDGSVATLEEVIQVYADGGRNIETGEFVGDGRDNPFKSGFIAGFTISDQDKADLIAFLESLSDEGFITNPAFSDPFNP
jgi:cytochrome c peroxidase